MAIRFPLPSVDRWSDIDGFPCAIVCAPSGEQWRVIAHFADGSTRELAPHSGVVSGAYGPQHYDSQTDLYWDIDLDAVDFEVFRPDSDPVLLSQVWKLESEHEAAEQGWATAKDVAADLATRNLTRPDREVTIYGGGHAHYGDEVVFMDGKLDCYFHHFFDATTWRASPGGWSRQSDDLQVSVHADAHTVADAIETYVRDVLWAPPDSVEA